MAATYHSVKSIEFARTLCKGASENDLIKIYQTGSGKEAAPLTEAAVKALLPIKDMLCPLKIGHD